MLGPYYIIIDKAGEMKTPSPKDAAFDVSYLEQMLLPIAAEVLPELVLINFQTPLLIAKS